MEPGTKYYSVIARMSWGEGNPGDDHMWRRDSDILPTFMLNGDALGIVDEAHAEYIVRSNLEKVLAHGYWPNLKIYVTAVEL